MRVFRQSDSVHQKAVASQRVRISRYFKTQDNIRYNSDIILQYDNFPITVNIINDFKE